MNSRALSLSDSGATEERWKGFLAGVRLPDRAQQSGTNHSDLNEAAGLLQSLGGQEAGRVVFNRSGIDAALYIGSGQATQLAQQAAQAQADCIIFDAPLSAAQQRNLEAAVALPVYDRSRLILEIFASRAQSREGQVQAELARLRFLATRLAGRWSHLERQRGGFGLRGGPGERQIELDSRMIREKIKILERRLAAVQRQRHTQRKARLLTGTPRVCLVGYTNAGKSTLFNALVKAQTYVADQLFATLDTTTRKLYVQGEDGGEGMNVSLADTVGFIRHLPLTLIHAFAATLGEATEAHLLLHVIDAADERWRDLARNVDATLAQIGAADIPRILVFNKSDLLPVMDAGALDWLPGQPPAPSVRVSAASGAGLSQLRQMIFAHFVAHTAAAPQMPGEPLAAQFAPMVH